MKFKLLTFLLFVSFQNIAADFTCSESSAFPFTKRTYNSDTVYHVKMNPKNDVLTLQITFNSQVFDFETKTLSPVTRSTGEKFYAKHLDGKKWVELNPTITTDSKGEVFKSDPMYFYYDDVRGIFNTFVMDGNGGLKLDQQCMEVE